MAKATAEPGERMEDAASVPQSPARVTSSFPVTLDSLPMFGATFYGVGVRSVRMELTDGRVQRLELPSVEDDDEEVEPLTPKQSAILTVIDEMKIGEVLGYEAIAVRSGYSATHDMRDFIRQLAVAGRLVKDRMGWKRTK